MMTVGQAHLGLRNMPIERVKAYFQSFGLASRIQEFEDSSATAELAAQALRCEPSRVAKTLSFWVGERSILIVIAGYQKASNSKF